MSDKDILRITLNICSRPYPLNIKREREEIYRKAVEKIKERVLIYQTNHKKGQDTQDFLALASLEFAIEYIMAQDKSDINPAIEEIKEINRSLTDLLEDQ